MRRKTNQQLIIKMVYFNYNLDSNNDSDFNNWGMTDLRNECKKRNLSIPKNAKKSDLANLLLKNGEK
jgi:hypothetical protein